jgi:hypothetical protein
MDEQQSPIQQTPATVEQPNAQPAVTISQPQPIGPNPASTPSTPLPPVPPQPQPFVTNTQPAAGLPATPKKSKLLPIVAILVVIVVIGVVVAALLNHTKTSPVIHTTKTQPTTLQSNAATARLREQLTSIQALLGLYAANNSGFYPANLSPGPLVNQPGESGFKASELVAPSGFKFVYTPAPSGCTTAAFNCKSYTLKALDSTGKVVDTIDSPTTNNN